MSDQENATKLEAGVDFAVNAYSRKEWESPHSDCFEMVYVLSGTASHMLHAPDGAIESTTLVSGNYFFIDRSTHHYTFHNGSHDFEIISFLFRPPLIDRHLSADASFDSMIRLHYVGFERSMLSVSPVNRIFYDEDGRIRVIFEFALENAEQSLPGRKELMRCHATQILITALQRIVKGGTVRQKNSAISEICAYVDEHYAEHITLTQICRDRYFSLHYVSRKFKETMGFSFEQYIQQVRMHHASSLLAETTLPIDIISQRVGYSDTNSFRNVFRKVTGQSPYRFRSMYRKR